MVRGVKITIINEATNNLSAALVHSTMPDFIIINTCTKRFVLNSRRTGTVRPLQSLHSADSNASCFSRKSCSGLSRLWVSETGSCNNSAPGRAVTFFGVKSLFVKRSRPALRFSEKTIRQPVFHAKLKRTAMHYQNAKLLSFLRVYLLRMVHVSR